VLVLADKARITVSVKGKELEVITKLAEATGKRRGDIVSEWVNEFANMMAPVLDAKTEGQAWKQLFYQSLSKMSVLIDKEE
jgi:hypothetical protein